jgi:hypothetical protein
MRIWQRAIR